MAHRTGPAALTCFPVPSSDPLTSRPGLDRCAHAVNLTGTLGGHAVPRARARVWRTAYVRRVREGAPARMHGTVYVYLWGSMYVGARD
jgi:hypothetical protein